VKQDGGAHGRVEGNGREKNKERGGKNELSIGPLVRDKVGRGRSMKGGLGRGAPLLFACFRVRAVFSMSEEADERAWLCPGRAGGGRRLCGLVMRR